MSRWENQVNWLLIFDRTACLRCYFSLILVLNFLWIFFHVLYLTRSYYLCLKGSNCGFFVRLIVTVSRCFHASCLLERHLPCCDAFLKATVNLMKKFKFLVALTHFFHFAYSVINYLREVVVNHMIRYKLLILTCFWWKWFHASMLFSDPSVLWLDEKEGKTGKGGFTALYWKIQNTICALPENNKNHATIMIDDMSLMEVAAHGSSDHVLDFMHYCHTLTSELVRQFCDYSFHLPRIKFLCVVTCFLAELCGIVFCSCYRVAP